MRNTACEYIYDTITKRVNGEAIPAHVERFGRHLCEAEAVVSSTPREISDARHPKGTDPARSNR